MNNGKKYVWIFGIMAAAGMILCITGYAMGGSVRGITVGFEGIRVYTAYTGAEKIVDYKTDTVKLEDFNSIDMDVNYGDITVEASDHFGISYRVSSIDKIDYEVKNGCLTISKKIAESSGPAYFSTGLELPVNDIKVSIPENTRLDKAVISNSNGSISCNGFYVDNLTLENDFGNVTMEDVGSGSAEIRLNDGNLEVLGFENGDLTIINDFGKASLKQVKASELDIKMGKGGLNIFGTKSRTLSIENNFGKIELEDVSIQELADINTSNGEIVMKRATAESMQIKSDFGGVTGDTVEAKSGTFELNNGKCDLKVLDIDNLDITSEFGAVKLELVKPLEQYSYELDTDFGTIKVGGKNRKESYHSLESAENKIKVDSRNGDIDIN